MEDNARQGFGDLLLVAPALSEREIQESLAARSFLDQSIASEKEHKHAQPVLRVRSIR